MLILFPIVTYSRFNEALFILSENIVCILQLKRNVSINVIISIFYSTAYVTFDSIICTKIKVVH